jgi:ribonucleoside-diphosphate reductase alpha chain
MDDLVDLELEAINKIINKIATQDPEPLDVKRSEMQLWAAIHNNAKRGRRTGLGVTALGDVVAMLGLQYGSDEAIQFVGQAYRSLVVGAYKASVLMAREREPFPAYDATLEAKHPFIIKVLSQLDEETLSVYHQYGRRNIALLTTAPVGSVSILTRTTSGIEPVYKATYRRRRKVPQDSPKIDFVDHTGDCWQEYDVNHPGVEAWMQATGEQDPRSPKNPYHGSEANDINWISGVKLQAAAQQWVCHAISRTSNMPKSATHQEISDVYIEAWKHQLKGFTVYRDGSRSGVLLSGNPTELFDGVPDSELQETLRIAKQYAGNMPASYVQEITAAVTKELARRSGDERTEVPPTVLGSVHARKRPAELECDIHRANVKGETYMVLVGLLDGKPYEVFAGLSELVEAPKKSKKGRLIKNGKRDGVATYNLIIPVGDDDELAFKDVVTLFDNPLYGILTRMISLSLRHGTPVQYVCEQLKKDKRTDITSFSSVIARVLGKGYIPDGTKAAADKKCSGCGMCQLCSLWQL